MAPGRMRSAGHCAMAMFVLALTGCPGTQDTTIVGGERVRSAIATELGLALEPLPKIEVTSTLANVIDIYSAPAPNEGVLVVVFDSAAATVQILGDNAGVPGGHVLRRENVVVLYRPGMRRQQVERVKRGLDRAFEGY